MKLTKRQIKQIHRACETLENEETYLYHSCNALKEAIDFTSTLEFDYADFFDMGKGKTWFPETGNFYEFKHERIMCLLMFAEAAGDVL